MPAQLKYHDTRCLPESRKRKAPVAWLVVHFACVALVVFSSGCTSPIEYVRNGFKVGPNYLKPPAPVAEQWLDSGSVGVNPVTVGLNGWWTAFNDPILNSLVESAYRQNLDLRTAGARILEARALRNVARGAILPQLQQAFGGYQRFQISTTEANIPDIPGFQASFDNWQTGFNLSWELDFWGRFRRALESANADLDASIENYDDVLVLLISEVAAAYVEIRTFQARIEFAKGNIEIQKVLVKRADDRFKQGAASKLDLAQMRSNLTDTQALEERLEIGLRQANNRLCVLLGIPTRNLLDDFGTAPIPQAPPELLVGIPADLLRRRPDIRRAERVVAAQSARIGVATSDLYPHFIILGTMGYSSENLATLFSGASTFGNIGPTFIWDVLNYGRLANRIRAEDARFQREVLTYQSTVLRAGREVEDGLIAYQRSQIQTRYLDESAGEAKVAVEIVEDQIKLLQFDINRAFVTANFLVQQQDKLAVARGDIAFAMIQVYKALGGGWELRLPDSTCKLRPMLGQPVAAEPLPGPLLLAAPEAPAEVLPAPRPLQPAPENSKKLP